MDLTNTYLIFLTFILYKSCHCLVVKNAVYLVQNEQTNQCLSAGPVIKHANTTSTIFKHGVIETKKCSNRSSLHTVDYGQQWAVTVIRQDPRHYFFQVQLEMKNTQYLDSQINARLRGEFISYFPQIINLQGLEPMDVKTQSQMFSIVDPTTKFCLLESGDSKQDVQFKECNKYGKSGQWNFTLIDDASIAREMLTLY